MVLTGTASFPEAWPGYKVSAVCQVDKSPFDQPAGSCAMLVLQRAPAGHWAHLMQTTCSWVHQSNYAKPGMYTQAVVSYDRKHWTRTDTEYDEKSGHLVIKHTAKYVRSHLPPALHQLLLQGTCAVQLTRTARHLHSPLQCSCTLHSAAPNRHCRCRFVVHAGCHVCGLFCAVQLRDAPGFGGALPAGRAGAHAAAGGDAGRPRPGPAADRWAGLGFLGFRAPHDVRRALSSARILPSCAANIHWRA